MIGEINWEYETRTKKKIKKKDMDVEGIKGREVLWKGRRKRQE